MRWLSRFRPDRPGPAAAVAEWMEPRLLFSADLTGGLLLAHDEADAGMEVRTLGADGEYTAAAAAPAATSPADGQQQGAAASYAATGIAFEANEGQAPAGVDFSAWGSGYGVTLQDGHAAITLATPEGTHEVRLQLVDAAAGTEGEGEDLLAARSNYFVGQDASQWRSGIANYGAVRYRDVYDGIDVRYYGNQRQLEYDFIVAAGADASAIGLRFEGVDGAAIDANGDLVLQVEGSDQELRFHAPLSYQRGAGGLETVASRYEIRADGSIGFVLGNYDRSRELVIDPVLDYATYLGASGGESAVSVATDAAGYVYVTGRTTSGGAPFSGSIGSPGGAGDIFVAKLKPDLSEVVWASRVGGGNDEQANAIAVDATGNYIAVTGWSKSANFPTLNADDDTRAGLLSGQDVVVFELDASGALRFSTYFGGDAADSGNAVAVDSAGSLYAAGEVTPSGLLTGLLSPLLGSSVNVFVNKYLADGSVAWQQQLGGNGDDSATGIAVGSGGEAYVVGTTRSGSWAIGGDDLTMNGAQATLSGAADGFLVRLGASGGSASYATFVGGNAVDSAAAVAVDGAGKAYVVGETRSGSAFTTSAGAFITSLAGSNRDTGFLRVYDTTQTGSGSLRYSTFIGGSGVDHPTGVAIAGSRVVITGDAGSTDLPLTTDAAQPGNPGTALFLLVLNPLGAGASDLLYGTYYGATATPGGVAVTGNEAVIAGGTSSTGYGTAGTAQATKSTGQDALVASFTLPNTAPVLGGLVQPGAILEDSSGGAGFLVDALLAGQVLDLDAGAVQGIAITGQDSSNGIWEYSTDGSTWSAIAGTSVSSALLLAADGQTRIRFVPAANFNGAATVTVRAWDRTSGSAGSFADTSSSGGTTAFSSATQVLNLTVTSVNDPPTTSNVVLSASNEDTARTITAAELLANAADADGDVLTVSNLSSGSGTLLDLGGGTWSFTPAANDDSAVSFTYDIGDGTVTVAGTASLDLLPVNDPPTAQADTVQATLNTPVTYAAATLLANDSDGEGSALAISGVTSISGGTAVLNADGTVTFTSTTGFAGNASFSYRVSDGTLQSAPATVTVDINAPPVANGDTLAATEDTPITYTAAALLGNDTDADGDPLTIASVTSGSGGTVVRNADGTVTFTPNANFNGTAQFSYVASDGRAPSSSATVTVNVAAVNDPPVAKADSFTIDEDEVINFNLSLLLANDTDVESPLSALSVVSVGNAVNGTAGLNGNGTFRFTPAANFSGTASFTYVITDGVNLSAPGTVTITVRPINDAPDARDDAFVGIEDTPITINVSDLLANDSDAEGSPVSIVGVSGIGAVLNGNGTITFTPPSNLAGPATFKYTITDGTLVSKEARVTINLTGVNDAPVAVADSLVAIQDTPVVFTAGQLLGNDTDVDGDALTIGSVASGTGGTATLNADGTVSFAPAAGFAGNASFTYTARDGSLSSAPVTVTVLVNDVPQARDDALVATEDTTETYAAADLLGNDLDTVGSPLVITGVGNASGGSVVLNADGTVTFTPLANFNGTASFTYTVGDGISTSAAATVTIAMVPVNDAPAGADRALTIDEDAPHVFVAADFGFSDAADGNSLAAVRITSVPTAGTLTHDGVAVAAGTLVSAADIAAGKLVFTPAANANGTGYASFTFQVRDDGGTAGGGVDLDPVANTITFNVTAVNDAPVAADVTVSGSEDAASIPVTLGGTDVEDGAGLTVTLQGLPANGALYTDATLTTLAVTGMAYASGSFYFVPAADFNGTASFTYTVSDSGGLADATQATATIAVAALNDAPAGADQVLTIDEDGSHVFVTADFGFTDAADGDALAGVRITTLPTAGVLSVDGVAVAAGTLVSMADIVAGKLAFTPVADANGTGYASFTFQVRDDGGTAGGGVDLDPVANTISFDVTPVNDAPAGTDATLTVAEDGSHTFVAGDFGFTDAVDGDSLAAVRITSVPAAGSLTLDGVAVTAGTLVSLADIVAGKLVFTPVANANGPGYASFTFQVQDDGGTAGGGVDLDPMANTITFDVSAVNDAPAGTDKTLAIAEDGSHTFVAADFGFSDAADGDNFSAVRITSLPAAGMLAVNGVAVTAGTLVSMADILAGKLVFTPATNANGLASASFQFQVQDDGGTAGGGVDLDPVANTITFDVTAVNDAPGGTDATITIDEDGSHTFAASDFGFTDAADGHNLAAVRITSLPTAGMLSLDGVAVAAGTLVSVADVTAGKLVFTPAANANGAGYASFSFQVQDDGGTGGGGVDLDPVADTITFDVTPVNDAPGGADATITIGEDGSHAFAATDFGFTDAADGDDLAAVRIVSLPTAGTLTVDGVAVTAGTLVSLADIVAGKLVFTPAANANGLAYASFRFQVQDDGGTTGGGVDLDPVANIITLDVTPVNDAPAGADAAIAIGEDGSHTLVAADFGFTDATDGNGLAAVRITSLPTAGVLTVNGLAVTAGTWVSAADIAAGKLVFTPAANANGTGYASFTFQVRDDGGTAGSGTDVAPVANTITFDVTPVNDAPAGTDTTIPLGEDGSHVFVAADFGFTDAADGDDLAAVRITTVPTAGVLTVNGVAVTAGTLVSVADIVAGKLVFTPAANANGATYASFRFQVQDDGGAAGGGVDLDPVANTITIEVTAVNDAPAGADKTVTIGEDGSRTFAAADFGFTDAVEGNGFSAVRITSLPTAGMLTVNGVAVTAGTLVSLADIAAGKLVFTPAANGNGPGYASFTFQVQDDGGTAGGGVDLDPLANTITFDVTPVNDAPTGTDATVSVDEDGSHTFTAADFGFTDAIDGDALAAVRITTVPTAGLLTLDGVAVTAGTLVSLADLAAGKLVFTPVANANGSGYASFTFQVQDDGGTAGGGVDLDPVANTITINVTPVNDAPTGTDATITLQEDGSHAFALADFGFADGLDGNNFAAVRITSLPTAGLLTLNGVAVTAGTLVSVTDIAAGQLAFTPGANANGAAYASFRFQVQDDGGTAGGGADLDPVANTITFNVTAVNDAPVAADVAASGSEDAASIPVTLGGTDVEDGAGLTFTLQGLPADGTLYTDATLTTLAVAGTAYASGSFHFVPAANFNGTASFTYTVTDSGGLSSATPATVTIAVAAVNDAPDVAPVVLPAVAEDGGAIILAPAQLLQGASDVDGPALSVTNLAASSGTLVARADGTWSYTADADFNGVVTFTYSVGDGLASVAGSARLVVTAVNDAPVITSLGGAPASTVAVSENGTSVVTVGASDVDDRLQDLVYTIAGGADAGLFTIDPATGALSFVRAPDFEAPADADRDNLYEVVVQVSDGSLSDQQVLSVRVADVGESAPEPPPPVTPPPGPTPPADPPVHPVPPAPAPQPPVPPPPAPPPAPGHTSQSLQDALGPTPDVPVVQRDDGTLSFPAPVARLLAEADAGRILRTVVFDRGGLELISAQGQGELLLSRLGTALGSDGAGLADLQRSLRSTAFTGELDRLRQSVREELDLDQSMAVSVASVSFGLSLVYILWLIRGGVLVGSYLSALPAWRILDPLPVLSRVDEEDESEEEPLHDDGQSGRNTLRGFG